MTFLRKTVIGGLAALTLAAGVTALSAPAEARWHGRGWGGPGVAAGVIGGLAVGAFAAQAYNRPYYPAYGYGYAPSYGSGYGYAPAYSYGHGCFNQRRPAHDRWGNFVGYRFVRVCR